MKRRISRRREPGGGVSLTRGDQEPGEGGRGRQREVRRVLGVLQRAFGPVELVTVRPRDEPGAVAQAAGPTETEDGAVVIPPAPETRRGFLRALHDGCEGLLEMRALPSRARAFLALGDTAGVEAFVARAAADNVYIAVATRADASSGALANCRHLGALFTEVDFKTTPEVQARARVAQFLPPSAVVLSGGGLHLYWGLRVPLDLRDPEACARARQLLRRHARARGADHSAGEPARVLRLPGTFNRKPAYGAPRRVELETFEPSRRYDPSEFDDLLPPEPAANGHGAPFTMPDEPLAEGEGRNNGLYRLVRALRAKNVNAGSIVAAAEAENARFRPPLPADELHRLLRHALTQPDTAAFAGARHGLQALAPDRRPVIPVSGDLAEMTRAAWEALTAANEPPRIFRRGSVATRLEPDDDGAPMTRPMTPDRMRHAVARASRWTRTERTRRGERALETLPPVAVVLDLLATPDPPLPVLDRIVEVPTFTATGRLRLTPGYDRDGRAYFAPPAGLTVPAIPEHPTPAEIGAAALLLLDDLLGDFCFVGPAERAHAVALLLLPFMRELIPGPTPLHLIEAPTPGTGKTLLADVCLWPSLGRPAPAMAEGRDDDEWRKRLTAKLLAGASVVFLDNLRCRLDSAAVSTAITAPAWEDRVLGRSETQTVPVRCTWLASGNNPALSLEMTRRTVRIRLDAKTEEPWRRTGFRHLDIRAWEREHRGRIIAAALTLGRAWLDAGRPAGTATLGMFEHWARVLGGVLAVANVPGFLINLGDFYQDADLESAEVRAFLAAWWAAHGENRVTTSDLLSVDPLPGRVTDGGQRREDRGHATRLGKFLSSVRDRHYRLPDGPDVRVERAGDVRGGVASWRLRPGSERWT